VSLIKSSHHRILGLDILRSAAILLVVYTHIAPFLSYYFPMLEGIIIPDGVTVFFVLSGYLIGQLILKQLQTKEEFTFSDVFTFLKRRWWRTLPNYYLFLLLNFILIYWQLIPGQFRIYNFTYFIFCQNLIKPFDFMFWESWSLSIEEWFYLVFPILIFLVFRFTKWTKEKVYVSVCLLFITIPLLVRTITDSPNETIALWDLWYRKLVITHTDAIGYGMLSAFLLQRYSYFFQQKRWYLFSLGLLCLLFFSSFSFDENRLFYKTIYLSVIAICVALTLPAISTIKTLKFGTNTFSSLSKWSYSLYLVHLPLLFIMVNNFRANTKIDSLIFISIYLALAIFISSLIYTYFEKPLMDFRDKPIQKL
jgi:peptidoglycan/LPS O-acetylase OafA/YrhL